jgi:hypothetical protein
VTLDSDHRTLRGVVWTPGGTRTVPRTNRRVTPNNPTGLCFLNSNSKPRNELRPRWLAAAGSAIHFPDERLIPSLHRTMPARISPALGRVRVLPREEHRFLEVGPGASYARGNRPPSPAWAQSGTEISSLSREEAAFGGTGAKTPGIGLSATSSVRQR